MRVPVNVLTQGKDMPTAINQNRFKAALAEMYVQEVSPRKVAWITEELCGFQISSSQVSWVTAIMDEQLTAWLERSLEGFTYVVLDARYEKVRHGGRVIACAVLIALGVDTAGKRQILGCSVLSSLSVMHMKS